MRGRGHFRYTYPLYQFPSFSIILEPRVPSFLTYIRPHKVLQNRPPPNALNLALTHSTTARRRLCKTTIPATSELRLLRSAPIRDHDFKGYKTCTQPAQKAQPIDGKVTFFDEVSVGPELSVPSPIARNSRRSAPLLEPSPSTSSGIRAMT